MAQMIWMFQMLRESWRHRGRVLIGMGMLELEVLSILGGQGGLMLTDQGRKVIRHLMMELSVRGDMLHIDKKNG